MGPLHTGGVGIWSVGFRGEVSGRGGGGPEKPEKNPRSRVRTSNQPVPHRWETSALTNAPSLLPSIHHFRFITQGKIELIPIVELAIEYIKLVLY